jgi:hypothetical protein
MKHFNEEVFRYLTKEGNFETAFEICQYFPDIKETLIIDFWKLVETKLKEYDKNSEWQIILSDNILQKESSLDIKKEKWYGLTIHYGDLSSRLYYGIYFDYNKRNKDRDKINAYINESKKLTNRLKITPDNQWHLGWCYKEYNFFEIKTLKRILPNNRDSLIEELAQFILKFAVDLKDEIDKINEIRV